MTLILFLHRALKLRIAILRWVAIGVPLLSYAEPIPIHIGEFSFTDYFSYYRTVANYTDAGTGSVNLASNGYYQLFSDQLKAEFDAFSRLRFSANLSGGYATGSSDISTYTGSGLSEGGLGAELWFKQKRWAFVPTMKFSYPFFRITINTSDSMIGDGTVNLEPGGWAIIYFRPWAIYGYLGYLYRDNGRASLLTQELGASFRLPEARIRAGIRGYSWVVSDTLDPLQRNIISARVDAGSFKYYSYNPTNYEGYAEFDYIINRAFEIGAGVAQSFYGNNSAQGFTALAMVRFRIPGDKPQPPPDIYQNEDTYHTRDAFGIDGDGAQFVPLDNESDIINSDRKDAKPLRPKPGKKLDKAIKATEKSLE